MSSLTIRDADPERDAADCAAIYAPNVEADQQRRQGIGLALYEVLFERLRLQRFRVACAGITLPNEASVLLHERLGFTAVGVYRRIGWKAGAWRDVGYWQLDLIPNSDEPPLEPLEPGAA